MVKLPEPEFYGTKENWKMRSRWLFIENICGSYDQMMILFLNTSLGTFEILLCSDRNASLYSIRNHRARSLCPGLEWRKRTHPSQRTEDLRAPYLSTADEQSGQKMHCLLLQIAHEHWLGGDGAENCYELKVCISKIICLKFNPQCNGVWV